MQKLKDKMIGAYVRATTRLHCLREEGQGTTEYAILVGVPTSRNSLNSK